MGSGDFEECWARIQREVTAGDTVRNWTQANGYLGDEFTLRVVDWEAIVVETPGALNLQRVPRADFAEVYRHWDDYCGGRCPRHKLRDMSRFSKYVISILHNVLGD